MSEEDLNFKRLIFVSVLSIQYHPKNNVLPEQDVDVIKRCLRVTELASLAFHNTFVDPLVFADDILF